jgi:hypothetical protein
MRYDPELAAGVRERFTAFLHGTLAGVALPVAGGEEALEA